MTSTMEETRVAEPDTENVTHMLCVICNGNIDTNQIVARELVRTMCGKDVSGERQHRNFLLTVRGMKEVCDPCQRLYDVHPNRCVEHKDHPLVPGEVWTK